MTRPKRPFWTWRRDVLDFIILVALVAALVGSIYVAYRWFF